ncbi:MazG-like family protein [Dyella agri]|uniref:NTP pyrophosphohydrolase MazG putative catalytic core domain-containing protein n=1 Tax=Dyella agri TaxID=1926869 RepID=A0ABW8KE40_9GAMM
MYKLTPKKLENIQHEMADVLIYLLRLADKLEIDLASAVRNKLNINASKYPATRAKGDARK